MDKKINSIIKKYYNDELSLNKLSHRMQGATI